MLELVHLREHHQSRQAFLCEEFHHLEVGDGGVVPGVYQMHDAPEFGFAHEIVFDECLPGLPHTGGGLCEAEPREVDQEKPVVDQVKIEGPRLSRCRGYVCELLPRAPQEHVDEGRLADVRATGERDLWKIAREGRA